MDFALLAVSKLDRSMNTNGSSAEALEKNVTRHAKLTMNVRGMQIDDRGNKYEQSASDDYVDHQHVRAV